MLKRITDKYHPDITTFRMNAIIECGGHKDHIFLTGKYHSIMKSLEEFGASRSEDIYRFTEEKWSKTNFDHIDVHYAEDGNITSISGAMNYGSWIRGAVYHFGLKKYSALYPSRLFWPGGHLERLLDYAKEKNKKGVFISIFPHEPRLKALCKKLKDKSGIPSLTGNYKLIRSLKFKGNYMFNNVSQDFFVYEFLEDTFDINDIIYFQ